MAIKDDRPLVQVYKILLQDGAHFLIQKSEEENPEAPT